MQDLNADTIESIDVILNPFTNFTTAEVRMAFQSIDRTSDMPGDESSLPSITLSDGEADKTDSVFDSDDVKPIVDKNFQSWDEDASGSLSREEVEKAADSAYSRDLMCLDAVGECFDAIDKNSDGALTHDEIDHLTEGAAKQIDEYMSWLDG